MYIYTERKTLCELDHEAVITCELIEFKVI